MFVAGLTGTSLAYQDRRGVAGHPDEVSGLHGVHPLNRYDFFRVILIGSFGGGLIRTAGDRCIAGRRDSQTLVAAGVQKSILGTRDVHLTGKWDQGSFC